MGSIDKACISGFLCRLCSEMNRTVIHIYGDLGQRLRLLEKINGYLPITISPTDPLPKTICTSCLRRVEQHYELLMRLTRIKKERFVEVKKDCHRPSDLTELLEASNPDISGDNIYQTEEDSRRWPIFNSTSTLSASREPETLVALEDVATVSNYDTSSAARIDETSASSSSNINSWSTLERAVAALNNVATTSSNVPQPQSLGNVGDT